MGRPPKQIEFDPLKEAKYEGGNLPVVPGYVFRWVNPEFRSKGDNWDIFMPVTRDSDIGKIAVEQIGGTLSAKFLGGNLDTNLIYRGGDSLLAYATVEANNEKKRRDAEAAERRIKMIDAAGLQRNVIVPAAGGYMAAIRGGED